jgi:hypothetical protein
MRGSFGRGGSFGRSGSFGRGWSFGGGGDPGVGKGGAGPRWGRLLALGAVFGAVALGAGCQTSPDRRSGLPDPNARRLSDRALAPEGRRDIFVEQGLRVAARTGAEVRTQLGAPDAAEGRVVQNPRNPAVSDSILTWTYPGVDVEIYRTADGRRLVSRMTVTDGRHLRFPDLTIGTGAPQVTELLGDPASTVGDAIEFRCARCQNATTGPVFVTLSGGRVSRVEFQFTVPY